ncbi:MAG TPA: hypothetical protein VMX17_02330 [Candidatus Glassbacteria bacterium]|nr:hypothetical protein [Candidatus Glassbacteria bacterium]
MVQRFTNPDSSRKVLVGNDTDVSECIITKFHDNLFLSINTVINEDEDEIYPQTQVWTKENFEKEFNLQYGSPMQYISKEDYEWMTS